MKRRGYPTRIELLLAFFLGEKKGNGKSRINDRCKVETIRQWRGQTYVFEVSRHKAPRQW